MDKSERERMVRLLPERERIALELREKGLTYKEIAEHWGVMTPERVRQIVKQAHKRLETDAT